LADRATTASPASITIAPRRSLATVDLLELWAYRELFYFLVWRDLKVRYKQTLLGAAWAILQPVGLALVLAFVLGSVNGISSPGVPYGAFALAGLVPWALVSQGVVRSSESLVASSNLLQKVYFPRLLLPISAVGIHVIDYALALPVLLVVCSAFGFAPGLPTLALVPLSALAVLIALSAGIWLSALNVRYRDVRAALPFLVQLWLFASPIAYSSGLVPSWAAGIYRLNPIVGLVEGFRWAIFQTGPPPVTEILVAVAVTLLVLLTALTYFASVERTFADVV